MEDHFRLGAVDHVADRRRVADVGLDQLGACRHRRVEVLVLARREVVEHRHLVVAGDEAVHEVGPDEPGASGHQRSHGGRC